MAIRKKPDGVDCGDHSCALCYYNEPPAVAVSAAQTETGRFYLSVPFREKDTAKAIGARWDPLRKQWYVPPQVSRQPFLRWEMPAAALAATAPVAAQTVQRPGTQAGLPLSVASPAAPTIRQSITGRREVRAKKAAPIAATYQVPLVAPIAMRSAPVASMPAAYTVDDLMAALAATAKPAPHVEMVPAWRAKYAEA